MSSRALPVIALTVLAALLGGCGGDGAVAPDGPTPADGSEGGQTVAPTGDEDVAVTTCADVDYTAVPDAPVPIRIGHGAAAEEPLWLMAVKPDLTEHQGTWYELDLQPFRATADRLVAYQAGELDGVIITPNALILGEARGSLDLYSVVTVIREADPGAYSTTFVALEGSGITAPEDLAGATIAIVDFGSHLDVLARVGVQSGGLDPESDVELVVFPFPAQEDALRGGQIDVAGIPEPFYSLAHQGGGVVDVFSSSDVLGFGFDLLTLAFDRGFVEDNTAAVCAWREDFRRTTAFWNERNEEGRRIMAATDYVPLPEPVYLQIDEYAHPEGGVVDPEGLRRFMDTMIDLGVIEEADRIDPEALIRPGVTAGH